MTLPITQKHPFSTADAIISGMTRAQTRAAAFRRPFPGVVAPVGWGDDVTSLALAYAQKMSSTQCFSHETAAVLLGMRLPLAMRASGEVHVTAMLAQRAPRGKRVRGHIGTPEIVAVNGLRVTTPVITWCQLGASLGLDDLVIAADGFLWRKYPLASMAELRNAVDGWHGRRGFHHLQDAMFFVRERTDSARETMLRLLILRAGFPEPMINAPIRSRTGRVVAHADLAYPEYNLVLEYDGDQHRTDRAQYYIDIDRLERITREGWRVIRINLKHVANPTVLAALIRQALADAGRI